MTFDEIVGIARVMRHRSIARELSGKFYETNCTGEIHYTTICTLCRLASRHSACLLVTVYSPVEAEIDPALGSRATQYSGNPCAERSGTCLTTAVEHVSLNDLSLNDANSFFFSISSVSQESW